MTSSGIRLGAWDYLHWKDIKPIEKNGCTISAKVTVYAGTEEESLCEINKSVDGK
jgi:hypothetical protein